jgi:hypothetical protein
MTPNGTPICTRVLKSEDGRRRWYGGRESRLRRTFTAKSQLQWRMRKHSKAEAETEIKRMRAKGKKVDSSHHHGLRLPDFVIARAFRNLRWLCLDLIRSCWGLGKRARAGP